MGMANDAGAATIVQSTIDLGHNLGLQVVAEGVEDVDSYTQLASLGCDYAQGYFLSKPLSPEKMSIWLEVFSQMPASASVPALPGAAEASGNGQFDLDEREQDELEQWALQPPEPVTEPE
jgi:predicted signal transduction protein with EAL and GGDEF domain